VKGKSIVWLGQDEIAPDLKNALDSIGATLQIGNLAEPQLPAQVRRADLVVVEEKENGITYEEITERLRRHSAPRKIPLLFILPRAYSLQTLEKIEWIDFVVLPFEAPEFIARARRLMKSQLEKLAPETDRVRVGPLELDFDEHAVYVEKRRVEFTLSEFKLLACLVVTPGRVCSRKDLLAAITEGNAVIGSRNVDVHLGSIRKKLSPSPIQITGVRGIGYKLEKPAIDDKRE